MKIFWKGLYRVGLCTAGKSLPESIEFEYQTGVALIIIGKRHGLFHGLICMVVSWEVKVSARVKVDER